jgi:hypothetical protein
LLLGLFGAFAAPSADRPIVPMRVCEIARDLMMFDGQPVAALGRYEFRQAGRWLDEPSCPDAPIPAATFRLSEDPKDGPKPPDEFQLDGTALARKFVEIRRHTELGKFRFGSPDYDRWAVVYGRVEGRKGDAAKTAAADLVFRGDGVVVFLTP